MALEIQVLSWDRQKNMAGLNRLIGSQPPPPLVTGSPTAIHICTNDMKKPQHRLASTQKDCILSQT